MDTNITSLSRGNPCAFALIGIMGRTYPRVRYMSLAWAKNLLQVDGEDFSEAQVLECLNAMAAHHLGTLRHDLDNDPGFVWAVLPAMAYELIRTGKPCTADLPLFMPTEVDADLDMCFMDAMPVHKFQLRSNCTITLELPYDLTKTEVRKIQLFLKALAHQESEPDEWPFHAVDDDDDDDDGDGGDADTILDEADATGKEPFLQPMPPMNTKSDL